MSQNNYVSTMKLRYAQNNTNYQQFNLN